MMFEELKTIEQFKSLKENEMIIVAWNPMGEKWDKEMQGTKIYQIKKIQNGSPKSPYPDEIILKYKGNIFFNFRFFLNGESKVVKEVQKIIV